ncbi:hypothetical protein ACFVAG_26265 [Streptomyces sp. NPDC057644]|uniref:hypothetical protein n=1 Tax=Streptomyces sp. NPDC057644 TaxID=3346191 RepID=UPI0036C67FF0
MNQTCSACRASRSAQSSGVSPGRGDLRTPGNPARRQPYGGSVLLGPLLPGEGPLEAGQAVLGGHEYVARLRADPLERGQQDVDRVQRLVGGLGRSAAGAPYGVLQLARRLEQGGGPGAQQRGHALSTSRGGEHHGCAWLAAAP